MDPPCRGGAPYPPRFPARNYTWAWLVGAGAFTRGGMVANQITIGIIGDFNPENPTHLKTNSALNDAAGRLGCDIAVEWLSTLDLEGAASEELLRRCDGLWCSPGSPYRSLEGALKGIRFAREQGVPFIGTCGGFQHAILEYARNVLGHADADTEESNPSASTLFITRLVCCVFDKTLTVRIKPGSRVSQYIGKPEISEHYYCNFGLNPDWRDAIDA